MNVKGQFDLSSDSVGEKSSLFIHTGVMVCRAWCMQDGGQVKCRSKGTSTDWLPYSLAWRGELYTQCLTLIHMYFAQSFRFIPSGCSECYSSVLLCQTWQFWWKAMVLKTCYVGSGRCCRPFIYTVNYSNKQWISTKGSTVRLIPGRQIKRCTMKQCWNAALLQTKGKYALTTEAQEGRARVPWGTVQLYITFRIIGL